MKRSKPEKTRGRNLFRRDQDLTQSSDVTRTSDLMLYHIPDISRLRSSRQSSRKFIRTKISSHAVWYFDELWLQKLQIEQTTQLITNPFFLDVTSWRKQVDLYPINRSTTRRYLHMCSVQSKYAIYFMWSIKWRQLMEYS